MIMANKTSLSSVMHQSGNSEPIIVHLWIVANIWMYENKSQLKYHQNAVFTINFANVYILITTDKLMFKT